MLEYYFFEVIFVTHYILTMADGETIEIKERPEYFELNVVPKIENGQGYIVDHNHLGKKYFLRNVVSLLVLDELVYQQQAEKQQLPKMHQIGFTK